MELSRALTGFALGRVAAPDITPAGLAARGWTAASLGTYLSRGIAGPGSAFGDMHQVVVLSTRNLALDDLAAMTTYLLGDKPPAAAAPQVDAAAAAGIRRAGPATSRSAPAATVSRAGRAQHDRGAARQQHAAPRRSAQPDRGDAGRHRGTELSASHEPADDAGFRRQASGRAGRGRWSTTCARPGVVRNPTSRPPPCARCAEPSFAGILLASAQADPQRVVSRAAFLRPRHAETQPSANRVAALAIVDNLSYISVMSDLRYRPSDYRRSRSTGAEPQPSWIQVVLIWVNLSKACSDLSRPLPDCL